VSTETIICPAMLCDEVVFCTVTDGKSSLSDKAERALEFAKKNTHDTMRTEPWYLDFSYDLLKSNLTPFFKWYPEGQLILTAITTNGTGEKVTSAIMNALAAPYYIPTEET